MAAIYKEPQTATWTSLCDFIRIPGRGVRFTCTSRDVAAKLSGVAVRIFGSDYIIKTASMFDRMYFVDLKNVPSDLNDDAIYDVFKMKGLTPLITPTFQVGTLTSRDRTHKTRALNTLPPSIAAKQNQNASASQNASGPTDTEGDQAGANMTYVTAPPAVATGNSNATGTSLPPQDPIIDAVKPGIGASFQEWVEVSSRISISTPKTRPTGTMHQVTQAPGPDGRLIFGIPCTPTHYEIAFNDPDDEDDAEDTDVNVFVEGDIVSTTPMIPSPAVGKLISTHSLLHVPRIKMPRKDLRKMAATSHDAFATLTEPEARLAAISAQPHALQSVVNESGPTLEMAVAEHAVLRAYGGSPSTSHGMETSLLPRVKVNYPTSIPRAEAILSKLYPDSDDKDKACSYALADLYLRCHAPSIYHDPIKVAALFHIAQPSCLQYSQFLLWSDEAVKALWGGDLGDHYDTHLPEHVEAAIGLITASDDNYNGDHEMTSDSPRGEVVTPDTSSL
ncbi:unnamed protein product [Phytophthora fragariaefolia]|uniref:Unnamed protein product n=1 Tax=Phytophthora fragariaefolia TaxID=1490495 RepID=A0A9W7DCN7_9STRA|nr:unnamed protein product [Phytophthora fragariaefolia]